MRMDEKSFNFHQSITDIRSLMKIEGKHVEIFISDIYFIVT